LFLTKLESIKKEAQLPSKKGYPPPRKGCILIDKNISVALIKKDKKKVKTNSSRSVNK